MDQEILHRFRLVVVLVQVEQAQNALGVCLDGQQACLRLVTILRVPARAIAHPVHPPSEIPELPSAIHHGEVPPDVHGWLHRQVQRFQARVVGMIRPDDALETTNDAVEAVDSAFQGEKLLGPSWPQHLGCGQGLGHESQRQPNVRSRLSLHQAASHRKLGHVRKDLERISLVNELVVRDRQLHHEAPQPQELPKRRLLLRPPYPLCVFSQKVS